jgi:lysophospholipase L1-like esterase
MLNPRPVSLLACLLTFLLGFGGGVAHAQGVEPVTRVACVGDSITEGTANADYAINSWPEILGRMLEARFPGTYECGNFGRSGATLLKGGRKSYWGQDVYQKGLEFAPQVVLINLGTNDATTATWGKHGGDFERDYRELIEVYRGLETRPRILLSNLTPMYEPHPRVKECEPNRVVIEGIIDKLAAEYELDVIDFKAPMLGKTKLLPDGLHPNTAGNELMAMAAFEALVGAPAARDESIRPQPLVSEPLVLLESGRGDAVRMGTWRHVEGAVEGTGAGKALYSRAAVDAGAFHVRARLRMVGQEDSAAGFLLNENFFGFEGNQGTVFRNGPQMGGLRLLHQSETLWERDAWIDFEAIRNGDQVWFLVNGFVVDMATIAGPITQLGFEPNRSRMQVADWSIAGNVAIARPAQMVARTLETPWVDLTRRSELRVELGFDSSFMALLSGGDLIVVGKTSEPDGNGLVLRRSQDGGVSWSEASPGPDLQWGASTPTIHQLHSPSGESSVLMLLTCVPDLMVSRSEDDGVTWSEFQPFSSESLSGQAPPRSVVQRKDGSYFALYHDGVGPGHALLQTESLDGGLSWSAPTAVGDWSGFIGANPGFPSVVRSPNGKQLLCLLSELGGRHNSLAMTSDDEGLTWSSCFELPASLTGFGHAGAYLPDGRLLVAMRDVHGSSPTQGGFVAWVGTYEDLRTEGEGQFTCRLSENAKWREGGLEISVSALPDGTIWAMQNGKPGIQLKQADLDELLPTRGFGIPWIDLDGDVERQVDREPGQYLGHVTTTLLEDGKTMLAVYPKGHGKGPIVYQRSNDAGLTWSGRLPTPKSWETSREVPTIHRVIDPQTGQKRLIMWSGLYPARLAVSEDDGATWSELEQAGDWGGIVVMGFVERLANGSYIAMFHDDGRFFSADSTYVRPPVFTLYKTFSHDGGLSWSQPDSVWSGSDLNLCEPGCFRSPDGKTLAVLLRENSRTRNSFVIFSEDEGVTWSAPRELPASLTGDRHTGKYAPDGRLFISFRDTALESRTQGDWVGWVGTFEDILFGRPGQYRVRLKDNKDSWDTAYPGVEVLPDGTFVATTYGHWAEGEQPYILSTRFHLDELDQEAAKQPQKQVLFERGMNGVNTYRIPALVTTNSGVLLASCDARINNSGDLPNNIDTVIRRSVDGGRSWQPIQTIVDWEGQEGAADPCMVVDRETGRVWCAVTWSESVNWRNSKPGFGQDSFHDLLVYSDDDGLTWSEAKDVTESLKDPSWRSVWFSPGSGIQSKSGRLFIPFSAAHGDGEAYSYAAISDDHGETWSRVGPMGFKTNENIVAQLADGTIVCNMRSTHGLRLRAIAKSTDDGNTWSELVHHEGLIEPVCQAGLLTVPASATPDGREWLVFSNPASQKRERLALKVSYDGGETWPIERVLHAGPTAYSCLTVLPQGGIGILYEAGVRSSYETVTFASISMEWLMESDSDE